MTQPIANARHPANALAPTAIIRRQLLRRRGNAMTWAATIGWPVFPEIRDKMLSKSSGGGEIPGADSLSGLRRRCHASIAAASDISILGRELTSARSAGPREPSTYSPANPSMSSSSVIDQDHPQDWSVKSLADCLRARSRPPARKVSVSTHFVGQVQSLTATHEDAIRFQKGASANTGPLSAVCGGAALNTRGPPDDREAHAIAEPAMQADLRTSSC